MQCRTCILRTQIEHSIFLRYGLEGHEWLSLTLYPKSISQNNYNSSAIERTRKNLITICIEVQRHDLPLMSFKGRMLFPGLQVPKLGSLVHRPSRTQAFMWIKSNSNNLVLVTSKSVKQFSRISIPQLSGRVEASSHDFITS